MLDCMVDSNNSGFNINNHSINLSKLFKRYAMNPATSYNTSVFASGFREELPTSFR